MHCIIILCAGGGTECVGAMVYTGDVFRCTYASCGVKNRSGENPGLASIVPIVHIYIHISCKQENEKCWASSVCKVNCNVDICCM